jgi:SNF2 family DNA or RNA helicase
VSKLNGSAKTYSINDSSDEDDEVVRVGNNPVVDDGFDDEDTRVAMRLSLKESKKQKATSSKKSTKASGTESSCSNNNNNIETILDDSSDEEDGDQGEEYYDEEKETASNVLRSAEQLSDHVVRAMSRWFRKDDNNQNGGAGGGVVQGIIIDGAVSLGAIDESKSGEESSDGTHKWICKTEMEKAIPNVKLSGYQLIGVNWMALLNGMTCEVGTKGTKNVNGVLADEMGLVGRISMFRIECAKQFVLESNLAKPHGLSLLFFFFGFREKPFRPLRFWHI